MYAAVLFTWSLMFDSLKPHRLWPSWLLHPWDFPGKKIGVDCHFFLQGIFQAWDQTYISYLIIKGKKQKWEKLEVFTLQCLGLMCHSLCDGNKQRPPHPPVSWQNYDQTVQNET